MKIKSLPAKKKLSTQPQPMNSILQDTHLVPSGIASSRFNSSLDPHTCQVCRGALNKTHQCLHTTQSHQGCTGHPTCAGP